MEEAKLREQNTRTLFGAIPNDVKVLYVHLSHRVGDHDYKCRCHDDSIVACLKRNYETDNVLVTNAPSSFLDKYNNSQFYKQCFDNFVVQNSIDAIVYLCDYVCDGIPSEIYSDGVETRYHIGHAVSVAEQLKKSLVVVYRQEHCFKVRCPEREYITNPEKIKCPCKTVKICQDVNTWKCYL